MSTVTDRHLDLASLQTAWQRLNKLVPLGAITSERNYKRRVQVMDELLNCIGANESHRLMPLLDLITKEIRSQTSQAARSIASNGAGPPDGRTQPQTGRPRRRTGRAKHRLRDTERKARTQYAAGEGAGKATQYFRGGVSVNTQNNSTPAPLIL